MKIFAVIFIISVLITDTHYEETVTLPIKDRIKLLKRKIKEQVQAVKNLKNTPALSSDEEDLEPKLRAMESERDLLYANYDYVNLRDEPVTPVMSNDHRKKENRFRLRELKTTTRTTTKTSMFTPYLYRPKDILASFPRAAPIHSADVVQISIPTEKQVVRAFDKPVDTFYRRQVDQSFYYTPMQWVHCEDLITPLLTGLKTECTPPKLLEVNNRLVTRLIQLLTINTTHYSKQDVYAVTYQISNMQIRLFQWNINPMRLLMSTLSNGEKHSFRSLKYGLKKLFLRWGLDLHNITNLLKESRLFRPFCINVGHHGGSTKSSRNTRYTKSTETTTKCTDSESEQVT